MKLQKNSLKVKTRPIPLLFIHRCIRVLIWYKEKKKGMEKIKLSLFANNMTVYMEIVKKFLNYWDNLIIEFGVITGYLNVI